jgi:hypothetical protein
MPVIKTSQNKVVVNEPEPGDLFVKVVWHGPGDGNHMQGFDGRIEPIEGYQATIDWAVSMADQMQFPLYVVPLRARDVFKPREVLTVLPHLTDQERGKLRAYIVKAMAEVMRDCTDPAMRADAYAVMEQLGVIQQ